MATSQVFVTIIGFFLCLFIAWFFWLAPKGQTKASTGAGGVQEVAITVKGGYTPDIIVVKAGQPIRIHFTRQESSACSEMVLFPDFNQSAKLPEGQEVMVDLNPKKAGEYGFQCQMGMIEENLSLSKTYHSPNFSDRDTTLYIRGGIIAWFEVWTECQSAE